MKKILYTTCAAFMLVIVFRMDAGAQNVKFEDDNFKQAVLAQGVDTNGDGEVQLSEAKVVTKLYVDKASITSLAGIKSFVNLEEFGCYDNDLKVLDMAGMKTVRAIYAFNNKLINANLRGMTNLENIYLSYNKLTNVDLSTCKNLVEVKMDHNALRKLELNNYARLEVIEVQNNVITEFSCVNNLALKRLQITYNYLSKVDLTSCKNLEWVWIYNNEFLQELKIKGLRKLRELDCTPPHRLTNLNMSGTVSLAKFTW
ncbi:leucine-rich repeat domain-containing protein [Chitinophaga sp. Mgbs1]|uniref:Leucine-rich repeat domain-containing protein n=1 Tax=Chitinophaga solisilvae TaxID=1233460 RepID=A0A433WAW7_9BACT|nr:leucine-rich repeat domain-containing protein [Chitinophaga solisilvae]